MKSKKLSLVVLLAAAVSLPALAQLQSSQRPAGGEDNPQGGPAGVPVGPMKAYPGIDFSIGHNDNLLMQPNNERSTAVTTISPYIKLEGKSGPNKFDLRYRGTFGRYSDSSEDNYDDHQFEANGQFVFGAHADLRLRGEQLYSHDPRGSTDRALSPEPDQWRQSTIFGLFGYGAKDAKGRIELDGAAIDRTYTNNRATTQFSDRDNTDVGATFFWRVAPKTRLLFQARQLDINYTHDFTTAPGTLDSKENRYYVGAQWEATAKTSGYAKFGRMKKDFSSAQRTDQSSGSWDVGLRWSPRSYSVVDLATSKQFAESTGIGDALQRKTYAAAWTHAWNSRLSHNLSYTRLHDDFVGAGSTRNDDYDVYGLKVNYQFRRWLKFGAEYTYTKRDSNQQAFDFKQNLLLFTLGATL